MYSLRAAPVGVGRRGPRPAAVVGGFDTAEPA